MRRMQRISGRNDDMIILRGVNLHQLTGFAIRQHPVRLTVDDLRTEVVFPDVRAVLTLSANIKTYIGCSVTIELAPPNSLARSEGKLQRVYDLRT